MEQLVVGKICQFTLWLINCKVIYKIINVIKHEQFIFLINYKFNKCLFGTISCHTGVVKDAFEVTAITLWRKFRGLNMMGMELSYSVSCKNIGKTTNFSFKLHRN